MVGDVLMFAYPAAVPLIDYTVHDYGEGAVITQWDEKTLGPQPTEQELAAIAASPEFKAYLDPAARAKRASVERITPELLATAKLVLKAAGQVPPDDATLKAQLAGEITIAAVTPEVIR